MESNEPDSARLHRIGITFDEARALELLWNTEALRLIADQRTGSLADHGYSPLDSLDAIWHELEEGPANRYMGYGMTPHQAFLLDTHRQGQPEDPACLYDLLDAPLPLDLRIKILLVSQSPEEAKGLTAHCSGEATHPDGHDFEAVIAEVESRAASLSVQIEPCDCDDQPKPALRLV